MSSRIKRREFIKGLTACTASAAAWGAFPNVGMSVAEAALGNRELFVINLRGGYDCLDIFEPDMGALADIRPTLFSGPGGGNRFMNTNLYMHPALSIFDTLQAAGDLAVVNKVAIDYMNRSHAEAERSYAEGKQSFLESGGTGWINRLGQANFASNYYGVMDFSGGHYACKQGTYNGQYLNNLSDVGFDNDYSQSGNENDFRRDSAFNIANAWAHGGGMHQQALQEGAASVEQSIEQIQALVSGATFPGGAFPNTGLGRALRDSFTSIRGGIGTKVCYATAGGYDTHANQASGLNSRLGEVNGAIAALVANLQHPSVNRWHRSIILIHSEFGRTNRENGNMGTDHGGAMDCYLIGGPVNGGRYGTGYVSSDFTSSTNWLLPGTNILEVFREVVLGLGGNPNNVFTPGPALTGLIA